MMGPLSEETYNDVWRRRSHVLYEARVQARYHRYRQRFFDLSDKFIKALTLLLGASLFGKELHDSIPKLAAGISALSLIALVFGLSDRKHLHKDLAEMANKLVADIVCVPPDELSYKATSSWEADFARMCGKAPPALKALTLICEHEQSVVDGHPDHVKRPWFGRRWVKHFI